jgi:hypothetical protein
MYTDTTTPATNNKALESLYAGLETARERWSDFLRASAKFHRYSFRNQLMIFAQCPQAAQVAGFNVWKSLNRHVRKGEKGIQILAPRAKKNEVSGETEIKGFHASYVFDISQTEGEPLPQPPQVNWNDGECPEAKEYFVRFCAALEQRNIPVRVEEIEDARCEGRYMRREHRIIIQASNTDVQKLSTLFHEAAHAFLHFIGAKDDPQSRELRELEAESVAVIVSQHIGLERPSSFDYLASWRATTEDLTKFAERITNTAKQLITMLEPPSAEA